MKSQWSQIVTGGVAGIALAGVSLFTGNWIGQRMLKVEAIQTPATPCPTNVTNDTPLVVDEEVDISKVAVLPRKSPFNDNDVWLMLVYKGKIVGFAVESLPVEEESIDPPQIPVPGQEH